MINYYFNYIKYIKVLISSCCYNCVGIQTGVNVCMIPLMIVKLNCFDLNKTRY